MDPQALLEIANVLAASGATREEIVAAVKDASGPHPQRELNEEERNIFAGAIARAVTIMPSFRDAIALIRPFRDHTTPTLYTDSHSRVGIGSLFFLPSVGSYRRATLLLHEAMHVLNNHFTRHVDFPIDPSSENNAKDLEINSLLERHPRTDLSMLLLPSQEQFRFPEVKSYEQYAKLMRDRGMLAPEEIPGSGGEPQEPTGGQPQDSEESPSGSGEKTESEESGESDGSESQDGEADSEDGSGSGENSEDGESEDGEGSGEGEGSESDADPQEGSGKGSGGSGESDPESLADQALEEAGEGSSGGGAPGESCDRTSSQREKAADDLKIEKASSTEQSVARSNTMVRIREEAAKSKARGDRGALMMLQKMEMAMEPSKVDWRVIFRNIVSNSRDAISMGRTEHTYRRVNRRLSTGEFIFPGMVRYEPSTIMAIDTSGSMSQEDFVFLLSELETIVKSTMRAKDKFKAFCVDGAATEPKTVRSIKDLDLRGGGGTKMEVAISSVELLNKRDIPDIFILATDGGTSWPAFKKEVLKRKHKYRVVVLVTRTDNYEVAKETLKGLADVIDISKEGNGEISH